MAVEWATRDGTSCEIKITYMEDGGFHLATGNTLAEEKLSSWKERV